MKINLQKETRLVPSKIKGMINSKLDEIRELTDKFIRSSDDEERKVLITELKRANITYAELIELEETK